VPIAHALGFFDRIDSGAKSLDLATLKGLSFENVDETRFPCLPLAYAALRAGGTAAAVLNAANEIAVEAFLAARLPFTAIARVIADTLAALPARPAATLDEILAADDQARRFAAARVLARAA
jgi:1-deoxy-D-xylulose-5-phosphate reductoisomerase